MAKEENKEHFKGVWIPREIWKDERLTWFQKCLWGEIDALGIPEDPCRASNEYLATFMKSTKGVIANEISELRKLNLIIDVPHPEKRLLLATFHGRKPIHPWVKGGSPIGEGGVHPWVNENPPGNIGRGTNEVLAERRRVFELIKSVIGPWYKRRPMLIWPEERELIEVASRPEAESELEEIRAYRSKPKNFVPRSISYLLRDWQKTLDQARTHDEYNQQRIFNGGPNRNAGTCNDGDVSKYEHLVHRYHNPERSGPNRT